METKETNMTRYGHDLPQLSGQLFLADGGIETTLIFQEGLELPDFAAFHLLSSTEGAAALHRYFAAYAGVAQRFGTGLILETATWRASADWGARLGYTSETLAAANQRAVRLLEVIRAEYQTDQTPIVISGCLGPRGDGYVPDKTMSAAEAEGYHAQQVGWLADSAVDMVSAITMNYVEEAVGIASAARRAGIPAAISFTVETDGRLPTGQALGDAITEVDQATSAFPSYFMINCAHPTHFEHVLTPGESWLERVRGVRANASRLSHAELNECSTLDPGDPSELGKQYAQLKRQLRSLNVMGGCCGTDHRHIEQIAAACLPLFGKELPATD
jgi:S-methylmethionine-dependent homocysteine/selenocysteine methylase